MKKIIIDAVPALHGAGQLIRTSLAFSSILNKPLEINNIRWNRPYKGLRQIHVSTIDLVSEMTEAHIIGNSLHSQSISFIPRGNPGGHFELHMLHQGLDSDICVSKVISCVLPILCFAESSSSVILHGETHHLNEQSIEYFENILIPTLKKMGIKAMIKTRKIGWHSCGSVELFVEPIRRFEGINLNKRGVLRNIELTIIVPNHLKLIVKNFVDELYIKVSEITNSDIILKNVESKIDLITIFARLVFDNTYLGFSKCIKINSSISIENIVNEVKTLLYCKANVDEFLADQLITFIAIARGDSCFLAPKITDHLALNIGITEQFLPIKFNLSQNPDGTYLVSVKGQGIKNHKKRLSEDL